MTGSSFVEAVTMAHVKLQLANEEAAQTGFSTTAPHTTSTFIMMGLEIEQLQYVTVLNHVFFAHLS